MTHLKTLALATILSTGLLSVSALAKPNADINQDGMVTRAEFDAESNARFSKTDINGDGYISKSERDQAKEAQEAEKRAEHFSRIDQNGDGVVSLEEFNQGLENRQGEMRQRRHDKLDVNDDGEITREDRQAMREKMQQRRGERTENSGERRGQRDHQYGNRDHWKRIDLNGDELISYQEYAAGADKMFKHMDADGDGVLQKGEGKRSHKRKGKRFFR